MSKHSKDESAESFSVATILAASDAIRTLSLHKESSKSQAVLLNSTKLKPHHLIKLYTRLDKIQKAIRVSHGHDNDNDDGEDDDTSGNTKSSKNNGKKTTKKKSSSTGSSKKPSKKRNNGEISNSSTTDTSSTSNNGEKKGDDDNASDQEEQQESPSKKQKSSSGTPAKALPNAVHPCGCIFKKAADKTKHNKPIREDGKTVVYPCEYRAKLLDFPFCSCGFPLNSDTITAQDWKKAIENGSYKNILDAHCSECSSFKKIQTTIIKECQKLAYRPALVQSVYHLPFSYDPGAIPHDKCASAHKILESYPKTKDPKAIKNFDPVFGCIGCWKILPTQKETYDHVTNCEDFGSHLFDFTKEITNELYVSGYKVNNAITFKDFKNFKLLKNHHVFQTDAKGNIINFYLKPFFSSGGEEEEEVDESGDAENEEEEEEVVVKKNTSQKQQQTPASAQNKNSKVVSTPNSTPIPTPRASSSSTTSQSKKKDDDMEVDDEQEQDQEQEVEEQQEEEESVDKNNNDDDVGQDEEEEEENGQNNEEDEDDVPQAAQTPPPRSGTGGKSPAALKKLDEINHRNKQEQQQRKLPSQQPQSLSEVQTQEERGVKIIQPGGGLPKPQLTSSSPLDKSKTVPAHESTQQKSSTPVVPVQQQKSPPATTTNKQPAIQTQTQVTPSTTTTTSTRTPSSTNQKVVPPPSGQRFSSSTTQIRNAIQKQNQSKSSQVETQLPTGGSLSTSTTSTGNHSNGNGSNQLDQEDDPIE
jgi:hypothetical protein